MSLIADECSSRHLMEELKQRIKDSYHNQPVFAKRLGLSRKVLSRILNHSKDIDALFAMCALLGIKWISIE